MAAARSLPKTLVLGSPLNVRSIDVSPAGDTIAVVQGRLRRAGRISFWDTRTFAEAAEAVTLLGDQTQSARFMKSGDLVWIDHPLQPFRLDHRRRAVAEVKVPSAMRGSVLEGGHGSDRVVLAYALDPWNVGSVKQPAVFDVSKKKVLWRATDAESSVALPSLGAGGSRLAFTDDEEVVIRDLDAKKDLLRVRVGSSVEVLIFSPCGRYLVARRSLGPLVLWRLSKGKATEVRQLDVVTQAIAFDPSGDHVAIALGPERARDRDRPNRIREEDPLRHPPRGLGVPTGAVLDRHGGPSPRQEGQHAHRARARVARSRRASSAVVANSRIFMHVLRGLVMRAVWASIAVLSWSAVSNPCSRPNADGASSGSGATSASNATSAKDAEPAAAAADAGTSPKAIAVLGAYACTHDYWIGAGASRTRRSDPAGSFTLVDGATYRFLDNGGTGRYQLDASSGAITWLDGPLADKKPRRTTYRKNVHTTQIDIVFSDGFDWSCGHNL